MRYTIKITKPRYTVQQWQTGFAIVDATGKDDPYIIERYNSDGTDISNAAKRCAEDWAYTWNIVEQGYCGACQHKFAEGEKRYPAVGFHSLDKVICFSCACSQED